MRKLPLLILFLTISFTGFAQDFLPDRPEGMVNDFANMLTPGEENQLENKLRNYRDSTTNAIVVATIESLQNFPIEDVARQLHNSWNIQYEDRGNGVLILIAKQERSIRIEVGYGLEGAIPDIMANRIINDIMQPSFRKGDIYGGIDQAVNVMIDLAAGEFQGFPEASSASDEGFPFDVLIIFIVILFILIRRGRGGGRKRSLGSGGIIFYGGGFGGGGSSGSFGGGGSGGFGGFGGGGGFSSGGGGASGGW